MCECIVLFFIKMVEVCLRFHWAMESVTSLKSNTDL
jgi:hypothetical protein